ncbi:hypothetical protein HOL63_03835 [Candidatus Peregrinibacteria bacterium]|jgi:23S rRNA (cytosine1962-C5)-methyltransferase|nr:hypothetical protein [Candidatus Peregrinibacteria bacterium]MBT5468957.1 hypothetical protein [Candidatus Peregrinibacteria bacterium]MBT7337645.1 hypothetical protein [Candidatus Peregrinibacteria bacterium]
MDQRANTYTLLDSGNCLKLEQVGPYRLIRSAPQANWPPALPDREWESADATLECVREGKVEWTIRNNTLPEEWNIDVPPGVMNVKRSDFGHLGIFPEQMRYWELLEKSSKKCMAKYGECNVLNLFAYTGGSTLACAKGGASVTHLDASKPSVTWARKNADASGLEDAPIRWIVDDVQKFVSREVQRGKKYHGIILDPPTYGKGTKGETWKIDEDLESLLENLNHLMHEDFSFMQLSAHSANYLPEILEVLVKEIVSSKSGTYLTEDMILKAAHGNDLPSGASCLYRQDA